jgi:hypothetical protein
MSIPENVFTSIRVLSITFLLAFTAGTSLAEDLPSTADPAMPNSSDGDVQERSITPSRKRGDLDIIAVYGHCRAYNSPTGQTLCGRKVCYIAKNLGPSASPEFKATVRLGGLDHTTGNYGPRKPLDTFGSLSVGVTTGERCTEFPDQDFLDPFQPVHFIVVELLSSVGPVLPLDVNSANNAESKTINYQTCLTQPGNQC